MAEFRTLFLQQCRQLFNSFLTINDAGRIVGRIDDHGLRVRCETGLHLFKVDLKMLCVGRHDHHLIAC